MVRADTGFCIGRDYNMIGQNRFSR